MFLVKLYHYNKYLLISFILFILVYAFINYKQGAVISPIYQFGMYSGKFYKKDTTPIFQIFVNNEKLAVSKLNFEDRDFVLIAVEKYILAKQNSLNINTTMQTVLARVGFGTFFNKRNFENYATDKDFLNWYKNKLQKILNTKYILFKFLVQIAQMLLIE
ncbi:MAG: hypothetical protein HOO89_05525 [Ferruginibacter sp.]|nr:hypothetical protein [Ferruginibacter sp.]